MVQPDVADEEDVAGVRIVLGVIAVDAVVTVMDLNVVLRDGDATLKACVAIGGD